MEQLVLQPVEQELKEQITVQYQILLFLQEIQQELHRLHHQMIVHMKENETAVIDIDTVSGLATENSTPQQVTITITENESAPTVTLTSSASSIAENAGLL